MLTLYGLKNIFKTIKKEEYFIDKCLSKNLHPISPVIHSSIIRYLSLHFSFFMYLTFAFLPLTLLLPRLSHLWQRHHPPLGGQIAD